MWYAMIVGVPTEIKPDERRVALTPAGAAAFRHHDHTVLVQRGAGLGSGFADYEYRAAGAPVTDSAAAIFPPAPLTINVHQCIGVRRVRRLPSYDPRRAPGSVALPDRVYHRPGGPPGAESGAPRRRAWRGPPRSWHRARAGRAHAAADYRAAGRDDEAWG